MRYTVPVVRETPPHFHSTGTVSSCGLAKTPILCVYEGEGSRQRVDSFFGKERDAGTGLYYYGARYLDSKTSRWLSADPALGGYVPGAPVDDEARKRNGNLPGMGGVFNTVNFHLYHYAGNNPVKYIDPDGRFLIMDDFILAIYLKIKTHTSESIWDLTWASLIHSWQHPIEHGKFLKALHDTLMSITISINEDAEINLKTDIKYSDIGKSKFSIRKRNKNTEIPTDEELSKKVDEAIDNLKENKNET